MGWLWGVRRRFWDGLVLIKYRGNKPAAIPPAPTPGRRLEPVSLARSLPGVSTPHIVTADHVPVDEASRSKAWFVRFQVAMYRLFPAMQDGVPEVDPDPKTALAEAYTAAHRRRFPSPILPPEYEPADLGTLAVASPYACYVERGDSGRYRWDLRGLDSYQLHPGLLPLGVEVEFEVDEAARALRATAIDCELGRCRPGDADWDRAQRLALCAATNHLSLVRHYNWVHLAAGAPFAMATRNALPADHPVTRLLWPHFYGTQFTNHLTTQGQMLKGGDFEGIFSYTHAGMCRLFDDSYQQHDLTVVDPVHDAVRRGIGGAGFDTPALDTYVAHFDVFRAHASRYLRLYYGSDGDLRADEHVQAWLAELDQLTPGGIGAVLGPSVTFDVVARLAAVLIYLATTHHEILGTGMWNYQMWTHVQPVRVYVSGRREPVDVYQRLVNANFMLNVRRAPLMQDYSHVALDTGAADAFRAFNRDLRTLQTALEQEPFACWKVYPRALEANINA